MKGRDYLLYALTGVLLVDIGIEGANFLSWYVASRQPVTTMMPEGTMVDVSDRPIMGDEGDQGAILIEFSDFECPYCLRFANDIHPQIRDDFVRSGTLRYAFLNLPLPIHPSAMLLARAGVCAHQQGEFWAMHDALFEEQPKSTRAVRSVAEFLGLDAMVFDECLESPSTQEAIDQDVFVAESLGITGTPAFGLGRLDEDGNVSLVMMISGAQPFDVFEDAINDMLNGSL